MTLNRYCGWVLPGYLLLACTGVQSKPPVTPAPVPVSGGVPPESTPIIPGAGPWTFNHTPGAVAYRISRSATIERADSSSPREISTNATHELLTLEAKDQAINVSAVIDTFTTTTQELIGTVQPVQLPAQISASLAASTLTITNEAPTENCSPVNSVLITDLYNVLATFPSPLTPGLTWKDSVDIRGCQAGVPTLSHVERSFVVSGEVSYDGQPVVAVVRADTAHFEGEGGLQQHRVSITANGTGTATYYLNTTTGQVAHLTLDQILNFEITTLAKRYQFTQSSKEEFTVVP